MRVLVTGADGFVGSHLVEFLLRQPDVEVTGTVLGQEPGPALRAVAPSLPVERVDIRDAGRLGDVVLRARPRRIIHLAAQPFVPASVRDPMATFEANVLGGAALLDAARKLGERTGESPSVLVVSSGEVYGHVDPSRQPVTEETPLKPENPYAASKASLEQIASAYGRTYGMDILVARPFNHAGPRQAPSFVCAEFGRRFVEISAGLTEPVLQVGNLHARRDFTDVRDVVAAYWRMFERAGTDSVFNVCSGQATAINEIVEMLMEVTGVRPEIRTSDSRKRPYDVSVMVGNHERLTRATGWKPAIPLRETLRDVVAYWTGVLGTAS